MLVMSEEQTEKYLRSRLRGDLLQKYIRLKKEYGVQADAEVVRIMITNEHKRLCEISKV